MKFFSRVPWRMACVVILALGLMLLLGVSLIGTALLRTHSQTAFAERYAKIVPLPVARVPGGFVLYRDLLPRWQEIDAFYERVKSIPAPDGQALRTKAELRKEAYEQLIRERFVQNMAKQERFTLPETQINNGFEAVLLQAASSTNIGEAIRLFEEKTGWTTDRYKELVVRPAMLETALAARAEIAGILRTDWQKALDERLASSEVWRFLRFSPE